MSFQTCTYAGGAGRNPNFDGKGFVHAWGRSVGSAHRHWQTGELVLCWSTDGRHPEAREQLRAALESEPGNVEAVLAAVDERASAWDNFISAANARVEARRVG